MQIRQLATLAACLICPELASAAEITVTMADGQYRPASISAAVGDVLRFVNDDATDHNVFIPTAAFASDLGKQEPGAETALAIGRPGTFEVECVFHPDMLTVVEVK